MSGNELPAGRGEISAGVICALRRDPQRATEMPVRAARQADPYGDDLQLALYLCYELHYRGMAGVSDRWEWNPALLELRGELEARFLGALRADVEPHADIGSALDSLLVEPVHGTGLSHFLREEGQLWHLREYAALRSLYHLKEADPEVWAIPRPTGRAKAAVVAVEYDEYGAGRADRIHAKLYADLLADLGLDNRYGHYLEAGPAEMLAVVNLMSVFGLHRSLRGALVGHYATVEVTSSPSCRRIAEAMERVAAGPAAVRFYTEHVEADAVHEQLVRREVIGGMLADEPGLEPDVIFGVDATAWVEDRFGAALLTAWRDGRSSLRVPCDGVPLMRLRWLVSQNGNILLRRQAHSATTGRSERTTVPSPTISTGPSIRTGSPRSCQTRRGSPRSVTPLRYPAYGGPHLAAISLSEDDPARGWVTVASQVIDEAERTVDKQNDQWGPLRRPGVG